MKYLTPIALTMTLVVTFLATPGRSEDNPFPNLDCKNANTSMELDDCSYLAFQAADKELNQAYQKLRSSIKLLKRDDFENQLVDTQLAWLKYRDLNCKFSADRYKGGTIAPLIYNNCTEKLTRQRTKLLKDYLDLP